MNALIKDCIKLVTITVIAGAALGAVYGITKEPIAAQEEKKQMEAYAAVFPEAAEFAEVDGFTPEAAAEVLASGENPIAGHDDDEITSVVEAVDTSGEALGYIFNVTTAEGYGGDISLTVGIQADGTPAVPVRLKRNQDHIPHPALLCPQSDGYILPRWTSRRR